MADAEVADAYAKRASDYIGLFGSIEAADDIDRDQILSWAVGLEGPVIDVGCGPGHWTVYLADNGVDVEGVDPVAEFVDHAQASHPGVTYRIGSAHALGVRNARLGGVLAWFSLIHEAPDHIDAPLAEFARCIRPGGGLAIGFFEGPDLVPFDHAVTTAYFWPVDLLSSRVEQAGFAVTNIYTRTDPGTRPQATLIAQRRA